MQLADDKKIRLMYRVEPGCLGPQGAEHIEDFCRYANKHIKSPYYGQFLFLPRFPNALLFLYFFLGKRQNH